MAECSVEPFSLHHFRDVIDLCRTFAAEADAYRPLTFDEEGATQRISRYIPPHTDKIGFIAKHDVDVVGFLFAYTYKHPCLLGIIATDDLMYVERSYRRAGVGTMLAEAFTDWAVNNSNVVFLGSSSGILPDKGEAFYRSMGYEPCGLLARRN